VPAPPHDGDKLRLYYFLEELKKRGHQIDLFCLTRVKSDLTQAEALRPFCRKIYIEHLSRVDLFLNLLGGTLLGQSLNVASYFSPKFRDALRSYWKSAEGRSVDAVLAHRLRMAPMAFESNPGVPVVLELTDCLTAYTGRLKLLKDARWSARLLAGWDHWLLKREEVEWGNRAAATLVISPRDAEALVSFGVSPEKVQVVPNGLALAPVSKNKKRPDLYPAGRPVVCFAGNMGYFPNEDGILWFHEKVWPLVKQSVPQAILAAVGGQPRARLKSRAKPQEFIVTGWVRSMEPYVAFSTLTVAPLRVAAGMQNKVALSLGLGVPVVATSAAAGWLEAKGQAFLSVADHPEELAKEVIQILQNPGPAKAKALRGKAYILKNYTWPLSGRKMDRILKQVSGQRKTNS
jgi:glycosyltransferase involved in cell wall biosynthesis